MRSKIITFIGLFICGLFFITPAFSEPPEAPLPPVDSSASLIQFYEVWEARCPTENGSEKCWVYVVRRRKKTECSMADIDGSGVVSHGDFLTLVRQWGCYEQPE